jgi:hypothetical protein
MVFIDGTEKTFKLFEVLVLGIVWVVLNVEG